MSNSSSSHDRDALDRLRGGKDLPAESANSGLERVNRELQSRADPTRVTTSRILWPWSREKRARDTAADLAVEARLDVFKDDLRSIRIAREALSRAGTMRAMEAAETAIFEIQCLGETARFSILNRAHLEMTRQFLIQLETLEGFRDRVTPEILDALKERALTEFSARMNRASKSDFEFSKADILKIKP